MHNIINVMDSFFIFVYFLISSTSLVKHCANELFAVATKTKSFFCAINIYCFAFHDSYVIGLWFTINIPRQC